MFAPGLPANTSAARLRLPRGLGAGIASGVMVGRGVGLMVRNMVGRAGAWMVARMMVMALGGERRAGKHHQQQGGGKNPFHGMNVAQAGRQRKRIERPASRKERARRGRPGARKRSVN